MFIVLLLKRMEGIRERHTPLGPWGMLWLLIVLRLALFECGIIGFWAPLGIVIFERWDKWRCNVRSDHAEDERTKQEIDSES
jgi:hypothetical protein